MESFNLNIIPGKDRPVCHASQYDIGRTIHINLFEGFNVFTLDGTEVISISVRKPDGNVVTESVTNTSDSYVEFVTTEQMTACHGSNLCELKLEKGADVIGTMNFILEVEQDPLEGGIASQSEIDNLATQVAAIVADQYDAADVVFDAAPTPGHGIGFAVTSEGVGQAIDDAIDALAPVATSGSYNDLTDTPTVAVIDDNNVSASTAYSSDKIVDLLSDKQDKTDENLQTTDTTVVGAINELLASIGTNSTAISNILTNLDGLKFKNYTLEGSGGLLTLPSYSNVCLIFIGRGEGGLYFGHWTGVTPIVSAPNHNVIYYANPSRINVTNNSGSTDMITVISN